MPPSQRVSPALLPRAVVRSARMPVVGLRRWRSMVRRTRQSGGKARIQRAAAQLGAVGGAPPQRQARAWQLATHRPGHGSCAVAGGTTGGWQRVERVGCAKCAVGRAPSLRRRQIPAEYALAIGGQFEVAESRGIPIRYGLPTPPAIVGPSPLSTAASRHRRSRPQSPPLGWALPDPSTRGRDDGFPSDPVQDDDPPAMGGRCRGVGSVGTDSGGVAPQTRIALALLAVHSGGYLRAQFWPAGSRGVSQSHAAEHWGRSGVDTVSHCGGHAGGQRGG